MNGVVPRGPAAPVALALAAMTVAAFHGVFRLGFVFDDPSYVTENLQLRAGFTLESLRWALTSTHAANWHPLTWLSHLLDVRLFGLQPAWHHGMNLLYHVLATLLLFQALRLLTGRVWPSAAVAALFAIHPLHVESVAWVAERKDLLCAVFWMLSLLAHRRYVARPGPGRYAVVVASVLLALTAKPMAVTLPCVLLLLDYWPLGRFAGGAFLPRALRLGAEKVPLLALAAVSSVLTLHAQRGGGALYDVTQHGYLARAQNAVVSLAAYLGKAFWPDPLAIYYPIPAGGYAPGQIAAALLLLLGCTAAGVALRRTQPYLLVGWLWFLGTLVPVIGLVQVGMQAMADRYTYLPLVGLAIALVWPGARLLSRRPGLKSAAAAGVAVALALLGWRTAAQVPVWRDDESLYGHALAVTEDNWVMHFFLAHVLAAQGRLEEAARQYAELVRLKPFHVDGHAEFGEVLVRLGRHEEALTHYRQAVFLKPEDPDVHRGLGAALELAGRLDEAIAAYRAALRLAPADRYLRSLLDTALARRERSPAHARAGELYRQGNAHAAAGRFEEAIAAFRASLELDPTFADAWNNLGSSYGNLGRMREAEEAFRAALRLRPGHVDAANNLRRLAPR